MPFRIFLFVIIFVYTPLSTHSIVVQIFGKGYELFIFIFGILAQNDKWVMTKKIRIY